MIYLTAENQSSILPGVPVVARPGSTAKMTYVVYEAAYAAQLHTSYGDPAVDLLVPDQRRDFCLPQKGSIVVHPEHKALRSNYFPILSALVVRDGYRCGRCGKTTWIVVDHIIPVREGGLTLLDNLQLLCHGCNNVKGGQIVDYRPPDLGHLGYEQPRYTPDGALIIRLFQYGRTVRPNLIVEAEVVQVGPRSVHVLIFGDVRVKRYEWNDVYPPDLQHFF